MKIAIGADHAGFELKRQLIAKLAEQGHDVVDHGTFDTNSTDYPDYAGKVAQSVAGGLADRGLLVCTTGMGMAIAANKVPGIRAALAVNPEEVQLTRAHNDANVLTIGSRYTETAQAINLVDIFLTTGFEGGRHQRRVEKIAQLERGERS